MPAMVSHFDAVTAAARELGRLADVTDLSGRLEPAPPP